MAFSGEVQPDVASECYRAVADAVDEGVFQLDRDGRFVAVDDAFAEIAGRTPPNLFAEPVSAVVDDATAERLDGVTVERSDDGEATGGPIEFTVETADGDRRPCEARLTVLRDGDEVRGSVGVVSEVAERGRDGADRRESEERFRNLMENSPFSIQLFDPEGESIAANPAWERLWDASRDNLADYNVLADEQLAAEGVLPAIRRAFAGDVVELPLTHYDPAEIGKPGRDRSIQGYAYPLLSDGEDSHEVAIVHHDVTDREERERELERYEMAAETVWDGITILDSDERFVLVNDAFCDITGHDRESLLGEHATLVLDESTYERIEELQAEAVDDGAATATLEYDLLTADGGTVPVEARFGPVEYADGSIGGAGVVRDVTERRERERRLEEVVDRLEVSNRRLEQFAYAASHDLQEPLRMVTSYLTLVEQRYGDELDDEGEEFLAFAVDGADRMREMVQGLLRYSRVDTSDDAFEPVDLDDVLADVCRDLQVRIEESDAEIAVGPLPRVCGDPGQLRQLFQNLLDNAIEYSGDAPPRVEVDAERASGEWVIRVADDGIGVDPAHADRIFEVFQRLHTSEEYPGTGIGLAVCQRIVECHGGEISVESAPGEGSTFSVSIPVRGR